ncbi:putative multidrug resistance protein MdtD [anaerobic digester metagenome]
MTIGTDSRSSRLFLVLSLVGGAAIFSSTIAKNPILPLLAASLGAGPGEIGLIAAASTVTGIATSLAAGRLSDRFGRRPLLLLAGVFFVTAPLLYLAVDSPFELALVRVYHGLATAIFGPVATALVTDLAPVRRGERLGYFSSAQLAGRALAPAVGGTLLVAGPWEWVFIASALSGLAALAGTWSLPGPSPGKEKTDGQEGVDPVRIASPAILATSVAEAGQFFAFGVIETFLPLYALALGHSPVLIGILFAAQVVARTVSRPVFGRLSDDRGRRSPILAGLILSALATVLLPFTTVWAGLLLLSVLFGLGLSVSQAATQALVAELAPPGGRGAALGLMSTVMDIGQAAGPVAAGLLVALGSYSTGFFGAAAVLLAAALVFFTGVGDDRGIDDHI